MKRWFGLAALALLAVAIATPAHAQATRKEIQGYIAAGYVLPEGVAGDYLNGDWNISGGAIFRPVPDRPFGIRVDLGYSYLGANNNTVEKANAAGLRVDDGYMSMGNLTAEALWEFGSPDRIGGYVGVGFGGYHRYLGLTATALVGGYYCDPWWGWCYPTVVEGDVLVNSDSLTKMGYSVAAGLTFPVGNGQMYLEARWHWMITDPTTQELPILLGYRF